MVQALITRRGLSASDNKAPDPPVPPTPVTPLINRRSIFPANNKLGIPTPSLRGAAIVCVGDYVILAGGGSGSTIKDLIARPYGETEYKNAETVKEFYKYESIIFDKNGEVISLRDPDIKLLPPRKNLCAIAVNEYVLFAGGSFQSGEEIDEEHAGDPYLDLIDVFKKVGERSTKIETDIKLSNQTSNVVCGKLGNKVFFVQGYSEVDALEISAAGEIKRYPIEVDSNVDYHAKCAAIGNYLIFAGTRENREDHLAYPSLILFANEDGSVVQVLNDNPIRISRVAAAATVGNHVIFIRNNVIGEPHEEQNVKIFKFGSGQELVEVKNEFKIPKSNNSKIAGVTLKDSAVFFGSGNTFYIFKETGDGGIEMKTYLSDIYTGQTCGALIEQNGNLICVEGHANSTQYCSVYNFNLIEQS